MAIKETVVFSSLVAFAVFSVNIINTEASFNSQGLSNQWGDVKAALSNLHDEINDIALDSQILKDNIENYQSGRTDYYPVSRSKLELEYAKTQFNIGLNKYFQQAYEFESMGQYNPNVGINGYPYAPVPSVYSSDPSYLTNPTIPTDPNENLNAV